MAGKFGSLFPANGADDGPGSRGDHAQHRRHEDHQSPGEAVGLEQTEGDADRRGYQQNGLGDPHAHSLDRGRSQRQMQIDTFQSGTATSL